MFLFFLIFVGLIVWLFVLQGRINRLENLHRKELTSVKESTESLVIVNEKGSVLADEEDFFEDEPTVVVSNKPPEQKEPFKWEEFFTKKFFSILGITSIVMAIGFFAMWAFANGWVGPKGRIAIGALVSLGLLVTGDFMRGKYPKFFPVISSAGIAGLIVTTYIATNVYELLSLTQSFGLYIVEVAAGIGLALRYNTRLLANFSLVSALIAPILAEVVSEPATLLGYLGLLSIAAFVVALRQRWIEVLIIVFVGVLAYENGIFFADNSVWVKEHAVAFLGSVLGVHILLGSGGVIRMIREKVQQTLHTQDVSSTQAYEMILFVVSLLGMNGIAYAVFDLQGWSHFGFFVLMEGVLLYGVSEYLKSKKLLIMHRVGMAGGLIALIFATVWEIGVENPFPLSFALALEGILLLLAGKSIHDRMLQFFGKGALAIGSLFIFEIHSLWQSGLALLAYVAGVMIVLHDEDESDVVVGTIGLVWALIQMFTWNLEWIEPLLSQSQAVFQFFLPVASAFALAYVSCMKTSSMRKTLGLITICITAVIFWVVSIDFWGTQHWGPALVSLVFIVASLMGILASFFMDEKRDSVSDRMKLGALYTVLIMATLSVFIWGGSIIDEPYRTLLWLVWGLTLLLVGIYQHWNRFRFFGIGMMLFLIGKMYLIDVWNWEVGVRVIAFLGLGVSLLVVSFLYQKKVK